MASMFHFQENTIDDKMNSPTREIVLKPIDGRPKDNRGMVDTRLFKGDNHLKAIMGEDGLWYCKFDQGVLPEQLKVRFTGISKLLSYVKQYYDKRNIEIVEVKNAT